MSKKRKKKSGASKGTGQTLSAFALIISLAALGLGVYQLIIPSDTGPQLYTATYDELYYIDGVSMIDYIYGFNVTYTTNIGDIVMLELSCQYYLDVIGQTYLYVYFDDNNTWVPSYIYVSSDSDVRSSGYAKHTYEATTAGERRLMVYMSIDDEGTNSWIRDIILTVTVY